MKQKTKKQNKKNISNILILIAILILISLAVVLSHKSFPAVNNTSDILPTTQSNISVPPPAPGPDSTSATYVNYTYGFQMTFPGYRSYLKNEYPWSSHVKAYNPLITISFATNKGAWKDSGDIYLDYNHRVQYGDLPELFVYDIRQCSDANTDNDEKRFCDNYIFSKDTSGVAYINPKTNAIVQGFWVRNNRYLIFVDDKNYFLKYMTSTSDQVDYSVLKTAYNIKALNL